jgi:nucleotide-binding universal stress UspA family protein
MPTKRTAYMPLVTYPDSAPDDAVSAAVAFAEALGSDLEVTAFAADIPRVPSPLGGFLLNVPEMIRTTEENSLVRCRHLQSLVLEKAGSRFKAQCSIRKMYFGAAGATAAAEARYFDLAILPWSKDNLVSQDVAQEVIFGAGRPTVLVPAPVGTEPIMHVALAWDASRVAARALADVLPLLPENGRITVLTVTDEKALAEQGIAERLASMLAGRGLDAKPLVVSLDGRTIATALQDAAITSGARLLAMGGFGHSRLRDFVLGGATQEVFTDLRLPVLLSH